MLPVSVKLYIDIIAITLRILMARLNSAADAKILWKIKNIQIVSSTDFQRRIPRPIINDHIVISEL
ncbi:Uncharacterised protein [Collinsella intestinalis]|nr:Uncharacterised protein [Collinsella intestinalis]